MRSVKFRRSSLKLALIVTCSMRDCFVGAISTLSAIPIALIIYLTVPRWPCARMHDLLCSCHPGGRNRVPLSPPCRYSDNRNLSTPRNVLSTANCLLPSGRKIMLGCCFRSFHGPGISQAIFHPRMVSFAIIGEHAG